MADCQRFSRFWLGAMEMIAYICKVTDKYELVFSRIVLGLLSFLGFGAGRQCSGNVDVVGDTLRCGIVEYLDCRCTLYSAGMPVSRLVADYEGLAERGIVEGVVPVIVEVDVNLYDMLRENSGCGGVMNVEKLREYRRLAVCKQVEDGKALLAGRLAEYKDCLKESGEADWETDIMGMEVYEDVGKIDAFVGLSNGGGLTANEFLLAEIPVRNVWDVFRWLPFGGWNACPGEDELVSVARYWYDKYGAVPAVVTHDGVQFRVARPAKESEAMDLATEQFAFCEDIVTQGVGNIRTLARLLTGSTVWCFWWD